RGRHSGVRHLPRPPDSRPRLRREHHEDEVRPPRRQPSGSGPGFRAGVHHQPEPWVRGRRGDAAGQRARHAPLALRRLAAGSRLQGSAGIRLPGSPGGEPGAPRSEAALRALQSPDAAPAPDPAPRGGGAGAPPGRHALTRPDRIPVPKRTDIQSILIIEKERPDALLPTMGGQTALNTALDLVREGVLEKHGVELIAASRAAIDMAEDRELFRNAMREIGLETPRSQIARSLDEALSVAGDIGYPVVIRPSFTLGGSGGGIAYNREELEDIVARGLDASPTSEVLLEESVIGWKEFEMEVVRDHKDNCIIVCSIENLDPMGVHTGDSITVAPALTLTDKEYQRMRAASIAVLRKIG